MLNSGKLNKRFEIQEGVPGSPSRNEYGEELLVWETLATVWGSVEPLTGREFWAQQQVQNEITVRFRIRYRSGVVPGMRIFYNNAYYPIKVVLDPLEKHESLELMCAEGVRNA